jgi:aminoglycoside 6'-N-acetyltransferase
MAAYGYEFRSMTAGDLPLVRRWLAMPHVIEWWGEPNEQFDLISSDLDHPAMDQFIVATGTRPFAYIQSYDPEDWGTQPFGTQPKGTLGVDQFIGEPDMVDRGHGSAFIRVFLERLIAAGAPRVLTDPDPANMRAVRAYEKAGFRKDRMVNTPDGPALLMVCDA